MIDLSDGLSTDLSHICEESQVGAVLYADSIPHGRNGLDLALNGGEDYELLFTATPESTHLARDLRGSRLRDWRGRRSPRDVAG